MSRTFFILGNHPDLSLAEMTAAAERQQISLGFQQRLGSAALLQTTPDLSPDFFFSLGGAIKYGSFLREVPADQFHSDVLFSLLEKFSHPFIINGKKFLFGVSVYADTADSDHRWQKKVYAAALQCKKQLRQEQIKVRFVTSREPALSSVVVHKNGLDDPDDDISYYSMLALAEMKNAAAAGVLLEFLDRESFRGQKIVSLLEGFSIDISDQLLNALESKNPRVRYWALKLLSKFKPENSADRIISLATDPSPDVRAAACQYLGLMKATESEKALLARFEDPEWFVRMHAVRSLSMLEESKYLTQMIHLLYTDPSSYVKESAKNAVIHDMKQALPYLEHGLDEKDELTKRCCVEAFIDSNYIPRILDGILSKDRDIYQKQFQLLSKLIHSNIHFGLKKELMNYESMKRQKIIAAIREINSTLAEIMER